MNLKILALIIGYYAFVILLFTAGGSIFTDNGFNYTASINDSSLTGDETDTGGLFGSGISFARFFTLVTFGIGLPATTPTWFTVIFAMWQSMFTLFSVGFIIASIWDG